MYCAQLLNVINARYFLCKRAVIYFIKEKALSTHEIHIDLYDLHNDKSHDYHEHYIVQFIIIHRFLWNSYDFYYHEIR